MNRPSANSVSRALMWIVAGLSAIGAVVSPFSILVPDIRAGTNFNTTLPRSYAGVDASWKSTLKSTGAGPHATLGVTLDGIDPKKMSVKAHISYAVPKELKEQLVVGLEPVFNSDANKPLGDRLREQLADETVILKFSDTISSTTLPVSIRLKQLCMPKRGNLNDPDFVTTVDLPISSGQPSHFPSDWYSLNYSVMVTFDGNLALPTDGGFSYYFPTDVRMRSGDAFRNHLVRMEQETGKASGMATMRLLITNNLTKRVFVYSVSLAPIALILLFGHYLFLYPHTSNRTVTVNEVVLEASGLILALLPARSILVGPDFTDITFVDRILSAGIFLIVAFVFAKYAQSLKLLHVGKSEAET